MCGIIGYIGNRPAAPLLLDGLARLEYRGYDSAGLALLDDTGLTVYKQPGRLCELAQELAGKQTTQPVGIGHTRWATHGAPTRENAHPHCSWDGRFAVVHNGIIENYAVWRQRLQAEGISFRSDTDTEVVAQLLAWHYRGDFYQAVADTVACLEGSFALGILCRDHPGELFVARRASPLMVGMAADGCYIASDVTALLPYTRQVIWPQEGDILRITAAGAQVWDRMGRPAIRPVERVAWETAAAEKNGYPHFMLKEIMEQPAALTAALSPCLEGDTIRLPELAGFPACGWAALKRVVVVACGSAYHAGLVGKYYLERVAGIPVEVDLASEFRYRAPLVDERTLTVVISQSGETADTLAALREARRLGSPVLAIVNAPGSTIARESDRVLYTCAGPEIAVATTKGYTTQVALLYVLGSFLAMQRGKCSRQEQAGLVRDLRTLPQLAQVVTGVAAAAETLAKSLASADSVYFIGRGSAYAVALEAALKLKEISYIHAEGYAAGELKHGTISLVEAGTPVVVLADGDTLPDKTLSNLREVKARGAAVTVVTTPPLAERFADAGTVLTVPQAPSGLSAIPTVIALQLLAYYVAKERGCDIDKPRNLAKSVTVE